MNLKPTRVSIEANKELGLGLLLAVFFGLWFGIWFSIGFALVSVIK